MLRRLHSKGFVWIVPNDDSRIVDALDLRREFWNGSPFPRRGVSVLEIVVALSRRLEFNGGGERDVWAGQLLKNLGLDWMYDPITKKKERQIEEILEALIWRTYLSTGTGGFFPLMYAKEDQTKIDIWYQMSAYILENTVTLRN